VTCHIVSKPLFFSSIEHLKFLMKSNYINPLASVTFATLVNPDKKCCMMFQISSLKKFLSFFVISCLLSLGSYAQYRYQPAPAFQDGEKIQFTVFYNVVGIYV